MLVSLQDLVSVLSLPQDPRGVCIFSVCFVICLTVLLVYAFALLLGNFSGTKKTEEIMVARGSMLELLRIDTDTDKLVRYI